MSDVGRRFAYRERARSPGEPVRPVEVVKEGPPRSNKVKVRRLDGEYEGLEEWIPKVRLVVPWEEVEALLEDERRMFEALDASGDVYDTVPYKAVQKAMRALPFEPQAGQEMYLGYKAIESELLVIEDLDATAGQLGISVGDLRAKPHSYVDRFGHTKTTITNSTVSGNSATGGGGLYNFEGLSVIENSTITKNTAPDGQGSGVASFGLVDTRTEVLSTIVSANTNTDVDFVGRTNSFDSKGYNLIGDGNATTRDNAFDQTGDQTGVENPKLGTLAENGGPTKTHALLSGSPAIDKGKSALSTDQRGEVQPFDDPGVAAAQGGDDSDIGSFEGVEVAPVNDRPTVEVARGGSCGTDYRSGTIRLRVSDVDDPASSLRLLASSSNRSLVPHANISFSGSGHNRTMTLRAADGNSGTALIEITVGDGTLENLVLIYPPSGKGNSRKSAAILPQS